MFVTVVGFFAILISGRMPSGIFNFVVGYQRWTIRVSSYYIYLMVDSYPPFTNSGGSHPADLSVAYPDAASRRLAVLKVLLGWLYVGTPHGIALLLYGIAVYVAVFLSAWSVLLFSRYPRALFDSNLEFLALERPGQCLPFAAQGRIPTVPQAGLTPDDEPGP